MSECPFLKEQKVPLLPLSRGYSESYINGIREEGATPEDVLNKLSYYREKCEENDELSLSLEKSGPAQERLKDDFMILALQELAECAHNRIDYALKKCVHNKRENSLCNDCKEALHSLPQARAQYNGVIEKLRLEQCCAKKLKDRKASEKDLPLVWSYDKCGWWPSFEEVLAIWQASRKEKKNTIAKCSAINLLWGRKYKDSKSCTVVKNSHHNSNSEGNIELQYSPRIPDGISCKGIEKRRNSYAGVESSAAVWKYDLSEKDEKESGKGGEELKEENE